MNVVILGDGLLGKELIKQTGWDYVSRKKTGFEVDQMVWQSDQLTDYDTIVNCIGYTNTYSDEKEKHWKINYEWVSRLVDYCVLKGKKLVHISTDYVYSNSISNASENDIPVHCRNWYGYTKLVSDAYVQLKLDNYLILRTSFKPYPFPYKEAMINQIGNFDTVNTITKKIIKLIKNNNYGIFNVGTQLKSMYDLGYNCNNTVNPIIKMIHTSMPTDISMDVNKYKKETGDYEN